MAGVVRKDRAGRACIRAAGRSVAPGSTSWSINVPPSPRPASPRPSSFRPAARCAAALAGGLLVAAVLVGGAAPAGLAASCTPGATSRLYLGQGTTSGVVAEAEWRRFVAEAVAARFPEGFTVLRGDGHWRDGRGTTIEEATHIVEIAHADSAAMHGRIRAIAADYRMRFGQEAVLISTARVSRHCTLRAAAAAL